MSIEYIREDLPNFSLPSYAGERYEAMVPDTLDVTERAALHIRAATSVTDPDADNELYWLVELWHDPPVMQHDWGSLVPTAFVMYTTQLLRMITGSDLNAHVDSRWVEAMLRMQGPDGLFYFPKKGRPWHAFEEYGPEPPGDHYCVPVANGLYLDTISLFHKLTGDPLWEQTGRKAVDGLVGLTEDHGDHAILPAMEFGPGGVYETPKGKQVLGPDGHYASVDGGQVVSSLCWWASLVIHGAARFYRETGYEPGLKLSRKLSNWIMRHTDYFGADGSFAPDEGVPGPKFPVERDYPHFYSHVEVLKCLLEYGLVAGDGDTVDFVQRGFEFARGLGDPFIGFFPETVGTPFAEICESDGEAGMIILALRLSQAGAGDYWDDADRWMRNQYVESQMLHADWVCRMIERQGLYPRSARPRWRKLVEEVFYTSDRVAERNVGAILSFRTPNDLFDPQFRPACHGVMWSTGGDAFYDIWSHAMQHAECALRVNLLLNHASKWADVDSRIPYVGRVDVRIKEPVHLEVRIPQWVKPQDTRCEVNGQSRSISFDGRYAEVGAVVPKDVVTFTFPISERSAEAWIEKRRYQFVIKGNEVVVIDPPGRNYPCYQRQHYRVDGTRWKKTTRFVPDHAAQW